MRLKVLVVEFDDGGLETSVDVYVGEEEVINKAPRFDDCDENGERIYEEYDEYSSLLEEMGLKFAIVTRHDLI